MCIIQDFQHIKSFNLYSIAVLLESFFDTLFIWDSKLRFSSNMTTRNFKLVDLLIMLLLIIRSGRNIFILLENNI